MREKLEKRLEYLVGTLERMRLEEYLEYVSSTRRVFGRNLLYGMARNVPLIGEFLAEVLAQAERLRR